MSKKRIELNEKTILVTGSPGFIGANLVVRLLGELSSGTIVSLDNMNAYYAQDLKEYRLHWIEKKAETSGVKHIFIKGSVSDRMLIDELFKEYQFDIVVHLAAQASVRYSIAHLLYASSSSVYGGNKKIPFSTDDKVDAPISLYAATKKVMNCWHMHIQSFMIFRLQV